MDAEDISRWFLAAFFMGVAAFYTARILAAKSRTGRSPVFAGKPGTLHHLTHSTFRVFRAAILIVCVLRVPWPAIDAALVPIHPFWRGEVIFSGLALMLAAFVGILFVHSYMGQDWRSGVPPERPVEAMRLITSGPFALSRNPILLLVQLGQAGFFLALPTVFSLVCLIVGVTMVHAQVSVEEKEMAARFGETWRAYARMTPRWLPLPGAPKQNTSHPIR